MNDYISLGRKVFHRAFEVELPSYIMLTQQRYESVTLGEKKDQTSTSNFVSDFDRCPNAGSQNFPFLLCPSVSL